MIKQHRDKYYYEDDLKAHRITVRWGHILDDTLVALRSGFDEKKHIRVRFLGEPAVDEGGPRREFFMLLMGAIANTSSLLDGPPNCRVLRHNTSAFQVTWTYTLMFPPPLPYTPHSHTHIHAHTHTHTCTQIDMIVFSQDELFLYVGRMIALSILHGGPGPVFFAPVVVDYLFGGISAVKPSVDDVPDEED